MKLALELYKSTLLTSFPNSVKLCIRYTVNSSTNFHTNRLFNFILNNISKEVLQLYIYSYGMNMNRIEILKIKVILLLTRANLDLIINKDFIILRFYIGNKSNR